MTRNFFICFIVLFFFSARFLNAQKVEPVVPNNDKKGIVLRPNTRDYGPNQRDNSFQRVENKKNESMFIKTRPALSKQKIKQGKKDNLKKNQKLQRRQMMKQRKAFRK